MSVDKEQPSTSEKKIIFCEVCKVACVSEDGLHLHNESERHKRMEEFTFGGNMFYKSLEDFIACPTRKEPVIGLQYLMQQHPNQNHPKAFMCSMCEKVGKLSHMIKHLKSYRHRLNYMGRHYKDLFPLFKKYTPYYKRELKVRDHASEIERKEASSKTQVKSQEGEIKNDYLKYLVKRHKELNTWNKKAFILNEHKKQVLQFMETFAVASQKEATWVQKLAEDMEDAMRVFRLNFNKSQVGVAPPTI
ncbi:uncharacterized protein LOC128497435 isoform X2 [Spea bombifrons]|uniref:uncharacterized protein LOC128497435 isoform X2 n=1 Tax=Spea bombifrons TaxID=233779 RepID=UPI00234934A7|nr:uncharacterized protein LOC128497435 isoform X2 [Spea bombifrons]